MIKKTNKKKNIEEPVTKRDQSKEVVAKCDHPEGVVANCDCKHARADIWAVEIENNDVRVTTENYHLLNSIKSIPHLLLDAGFLLSLHPI